jgi:hypothetical protein
VKTLKILVFSLLILATAGAAHAADLWLHVHVDEHGAQGSKVRVNLPLSMVETAVNMVPDRELHDGKIKIADADLSVAQLRDLWKSLAASPDATFVEAEEGDKRVKVAKSGGYLLVHSLEPGNRGETVDVKVPEKVVEALLSGDGDELDLAAGIRALAARGEGELVTVDSSDAQVRVWVDASAEAL